MADRLTADEVAEILANRASMEENADNLRDALHKIKQWADAYPIDIFSDVDLDAARAALKAVNIDIGNLHAKLARHIVSGIGAIATEALLSEINAALKAP